MKKTNDNDGKIEPIGLFFQYGEGKSFIDPDIDRNKWSYFPYEKLGKENYIAVANWDHQFEWRDDLQLDFDKYHEYASWIIRSWNKSNILPLTDEYKEKILWERRFIDEIPKLKPWEGNLEEQKYENKNAHQDIIIINQAIDEVLGENPILKKISDVKEYIPEFKMYFRDLN